LPLLAAIASTSRAVVWYRSKANERSGTNNMRNKGYNKCKMPLGLVAVGFVQFVGTLTHWLSGIPTKANNNNSYI
jgi:hypothetical protein